MKKFSKLAIFCVVSGLCLAFGCNKAAQGPERASISGTVQLDGRPIEQGSILFSPAEGVRGTTAGGAIQNGKYQLNGKQGPTLGMNRVEVRASKKSGRKVPKPMAPAGEMIDETVEAVSPQFNSQTKLQFEVKSGENTANFEVSSSSK